MQDNQDTLDSLDNLNTDKLKKVLFKVAYNGFWAVLFLRVLGLAVSAYLAVQDNYIGSVILLIISIPSFEYVCCYYRNIKKGLATGSW